MNTCSPYARGGQHHEHFSVAERNCTSLLVCLCHYLFFIITDFVCLELIWCSSVLKVYIFSLCAVIFHLGDIKTIHVKDLYLPTFSQSIVCIKSTINNTQSKSVVYSDRLLHVFMTVCYRQRGFMHIIVPQTYRSYSGWGCHMDLQLRMYMFTAGSSFCFKSTELQQQYCIW